MNKWYEYPNQRFQFFDRVVEEVNRAEMKFPGGERLFGALAEEFGEVAKALLKIKESGESPQNVYDELIQTAAMCYRLATEGDEEYGYEGSKCHHRGCEAPTQNKPCPLCT